LTRRVSVTRRYLIASVFIGLGSTVSIIVQAIFLGAIVERTLIHHAPLSSVTVLLVGLLGAFAARAVLSWIGELTAHRTSAKVTSTLRRQLLQASVGRGPSWIAGERTGELTASATQGVDALNSYFSRYLPTAILAVLAPVCVLGWILWSDWKSFVILAVTVVVIPLFMILLGLEAKRQAEGQWSHLSVLSATFFDLLQGLPTLRAFNQTRSGRRTLEYSNDEFQRSTMSTLRVAFLSSAALETLASVGTALVALFLGLRLLDGTVQLGLALSVLVLAPEVYLPLRRAGAEFHTSAEGQAAAERILDLLDESEDSARSTSLPSQDARIFCPDVSGSTVELCDVSFRYPGRTQSVLDRVHLTIAPGEHLAITGESGAGKSTILSLLLGFIEPCHGALRVGGVDLNGVSWRDLRRQIAWVPQQPYLVRGTILDNLLVGDPHATPAAVAAAIDISGLGEMVARLPKGISSEVGEGGLTLSPGERQRIAIARAVVRDAPLVLLDEPTAHIDHDRASSLADAVAPWLASRTVVVAAHEGRVVGRVDRTMTIIGGSLVEVDADLCQHTFSGGRS
jgi:thiol reductant ABC exporter CydD subunit